MISPSWIFAHIYLLPLVVFVLAGWTIFAHIYLLLLVVFVLAGWTIYEEMKNR